MEKQSRRGLLKNAAAAAAVATGGAMLVKSAEAQTQGKLEKKSYSSKPSSDTAPSKAPLFSSVVSYGNLVFLAGVGYHEKATIEEATKHVLDELGTESDQRRLLDGEGAQGERLPERHQGLGPDEHGVCRALGQDSSCPHDRRARRWYSGRTRWWRSISSHTSKD